LLALAPIGLFHDKLQKPSLSKWDIPWREKCLQPELIRHSTMSTCRDLFIRMEMLEARPIVKLDLWMCIPDGWYFLLQEKVCRKIQMFHYWGSK
jgi:hypothetical protein